MSWAFLLALAAAPASDSGPWIQRLRDPSAEVREEATLRLIQAEAEQEVRALLDDPDPEVRVRAQRILDEIQRRRRHREVHGTYARVSLRAEGERLVDVLQRLRQEAGIRLMLLELPAEAPVTVELRDAHPLEAILEICRASRVARFDPGSMTVRGGVPADPPHVLDDRWGVWLVGVSTERWRQGGIGVSEISSVQIALTWLSRQTPLHGWVVLHEATDDAGVNLVRRVDREGLRPPLTPPLASPLSSNGFVENIHLSTSPHGARSLTISGEASLVFPIQPQEIRIELPDGVASGQRELNFGEIHGTVEWRRDAEGVVGVHLHLSGDRVRDASIFLMLLDDQGGRTTGRTHSTSSSPNWARWFVSFEPEAPRRAAEIIVLRPTQEDRIIVPFRFENVPLR